MVDEVGGDLNHLTRDLICNLDAVLPIILKAMEVFHGSNLQKPYPSNQSTLLVSRGAHERGKVGALDVLPLIIGTKLLRLEERQ